MPIVHLQQHKNLHCQQISVCMAKAFFIGSNRALVVLLPPHNHNRKGKKGNAKVNFQTKSLPQLSSPTQLNCTGEQACRAFKLDYSFRISNLIERNWASFSFASYFAVFLQNFIIDGLCSDCTQNAPHAKCLNLFKLRLVLHHFSAFSIFSQASLTPISLAIISQH